jgi:hypothetical protein
LFATPPLQIKPSFSRGLKIHIFELQVNLSTAPPLLWKLGFTTVVDLALETSLGSKTAATQAQGCIWQLMNQTGS